MRCGRQLALPQDVRAGHADRPLVPAPCACPDAPMSPKPPDGPAGQLTGHSPSSALPHDLETAVAPPPAPGGRLASAAKVPASRGQSMYCRPSDRCMLEAIWHWMDGAAAKRRQAGRGYPAPEKIAWGTVAMATAEGTLVASYNRGMKLLHRAGGVKVTVMDDRMQRAPAFGFDSAREARAFGQWVTANFDAIRGEAEATTRVGRLHDIEQFSASRYMFLRFNFTTGDAAGQNLSGKATSRSRSRPLSWPPTAAGQGCRPSASASNCSAGTGRSYFAAGPRRPCIAAQTAGWLSSLK